MSLRHNAHAVIIGIDKYQDEKIPDLQFARADAEGVYQILTDPELGRIPPDNVILLLDENATQQNIRSAISDDMYQRAGEDDFVYIYFAGHGMPFMNPKSGSADGMEKYLVPADAKLERIRGTGIPMDEIQKFFGYIQSKQVMFFIDSCFSGEAGGRTFQNPAYQTRHGLLTPEFLDQLSGEGRLVVTACDVNELSIETSKIGHGLFTHYLMEGLKGRADKDQDGLVTIHELYDYVYDHVSQHALKLGGSMHPIQKGSIKGKIPLTLYETPTQKQVKALHAQAQVDYQLEKFNEAYDSWQRVIQLVPEHDAAQRGLAEIQNRRQVEQRNKQEILDRKQRVLLNLFRDGQLPSEEFDVAMTLIEKSNDELAASERETRRLLDALVDKKISAMSYVKSVRLLHKRVPLDWLPEIDKEAPVTAKIELEKVPETKPTAPQVEPIVEKIKTVASKIEPQKKSEAKPVMPKADLSIEDAKPAVAKREWIPGFAAFVCISVAIFAMSLLDRGALFEEEVKAMLIEKNFYDSSWNKGGKGVAHNYAEQTHRDEKVVLDKATGKTNGLMWQKFGSPNYMVYSDTEEYIRQLNEKSFAGFTDWRLPTLQEAMSLMEAQRMGGNLYINPIFGSKQGAIWTMDKYNDGAAWVVSFYYGHCSGAVANVNYVRAVRIGQ